MAVQTHQMKALALWGARFLQPRVDAGDQIRRGAKELAGDATNGSAAAGTMRAATGGAAILVTTAGTPDEIEALPCAPGSAVAIHD